ncbi:MAG: ABC transporter ATP-binding protein [candidate division WOR-3 bacterium]
MWYDVAELDTDDARPQGNTRTYLKRLWPFFRPHVGRIAAAGVLLVFSTGLGLVGPVLLKRAIDVNIGSRDLTGLAATSVLYIIVQVTMLAANYFQNIWLAQVGERGAAALKQTLFSHLLNLPMSFFDRTPVGKLISRVESDTEAVKMLFTRTSVMMIQSGLMLVGMSTVMAVTDLRLYLLIAALLPPFVVALWLFQRKVRPVYLDIRRAVAETNSLVSETLKGLPVIQVFCQQPRFAERMDELNRLKFKGELRAMVLWNIVWFLVDFGEVVATGLVLAAGGLMALDGRLTVGTLFLFVAYIARLFGPLRAISDQINIMQRAFASAERSFQILDQSPEPEGTDQSLSLRFERELACESVGFTYNGTELVLKDIDLVVRRGEKVALVGETGGGKSSIINLLLKFYPPSKGRIVYDGKDLAEIDRRRLRRVIGFVPQEVVMFPGTVLDNLRMFDETIPLGQVVSAAQRVHIHSAIMKFPQGYDSVLTEGGANFSLGERQLLAFARALVRDPQILILDEATSSVDPHTEYLIQQGLEELLKGRTSLIVAHRLATIRMADRVVVIHKGRVAEQGTHDELLAAQGIYSRLYRLQYVAEGS